MNKEKTILIINMPPRSQQAMERAVEQSGRSACFKKASELCNADHNPDIIIYAADPHSPDSEFQDVKELSASYETPLFALIASEEKSLYIRLLQSGIYNVITTPVMKKDLICQITESSTIVQYAERENAERSIRYRDDSGEEREINISTENLVSLFNTLINNLINQNKIARINLRKSREHERENKERRVKDNDQRNQEDKLWKYLEAERFRLFYQPVVSFSTGRLSGFEALIRIDDPEEGIITPDKFISTAENSAIIFPLGLWIVEEACAQIKKWKSELKLTSPLRININLSPKQFLHPGLTEHIFEITDRYEIEHDDIGFELTESSFMDDMEAANIALLELRSKKFPIYMDDFGTGYSSLSYLMHFPVNILKVDQSFVKWMHLDESSETIVKSIINLAHNLGLRVVAEGIDDECHVKMLNNFDCDYAQGYFISEPLSGPDATEFIKNGYQFKETYGC